MASSVATVVPEGVGYAVVVGIGFFFALLMLGVSYLQNKYTAYSTKASEEFNTASRNVKAGLVASSVVSAWTWAATLLQSSTVAYQYGISGPFWYAAGATVQIFMFSVLACKVKQHAPRCHTFLEIVYARYGPATHVMFILFALATNILVASQLLLGGSAVVTALTGMNVYAATWLIPLGVCVYVVLGGLRATFLCDYSHTIVVMVVILYFMFDVYAANPLVGSPRAMFSLLQHASVARPVDGNEAGSYLTLKSNFGLVFGVIQLCSGMGTVFLDQGYWQRAIASRPSTAVRAYVLGGLAWFAIPFGFASTLGLAAVALTDNPAYPTYPLNMTASQVSSGLAAPFAAQALLGGRGAVALLLTLFMAVTSSSSSELIAVSSILTFDLYKTYVRPDASPRQLIAVSHAMIVVFGVVMAAFASLWNALGVDLGWLFLVMGLIIGGAVMPAAFTVTWRRQSRAAAVAGSLVGLAAGVVSWLVQAKSQYGELTIATTGASYPTLAGNVAAFMTGLVVSVAVSWVWPDDFDWKVTQAINAQVAEVVEGVGVDAAGTTTPSPAASITAGNTDSDQKEPEARVTSSSYINAPAHAQAASRARPLQPFDHVEDPDVIADKDSAEDAAFLEDPQSLRRAYVLAVTLSVVLTVVMVFLVPIPMFLSHYIFSEQFFTAWVVLSFLWVFAALAICGILPVFETRHFLAALFRQVFGLGQK